MKNPISFSQLSVKFTKVGFPLIMVILIILVGFSSCKKDDNSSSSSSNTTAVLNSNIQQGGWKVTSYTSNGTDETNHYIGHEFHFLSGGTVNAVKSGTTVSGTWSSGNDDSQLKLILNFNTVNPFQELNSDWHVIQQSSAIIKLEDVSGGNGGIDYLTFEKI